MRFLKALWPFLDEHSVLQTHFLVEPITIYMSLMHSLATQTKCAILMPIVYSLVKTKFYIQKRHNEDTRVQQYKCFT